MFSPILWRVSLTHMCQVIPSNLNVKDGDNATLQVITNGESSPGLYNVSHLIKFSIQQNSLCSSVQTLLSHQQHRLVNAPMEAMSRLKPTAAPKRMPTAVTLQPPPLPTQLPRLPRLTMALSKQPCSVEHSAAV